MKLLGCILSGSTVSVDLIPSRIILTPWIVTKSDSAGGSDDNATMTVIMVAIAMSNRGKVRSPMVFWLYADSADLFLFLTIHSF